LWRYDGVVIRAKIFDWTYGWIEDQAVGGSRLDSVSCHSLVKKLYATFPLLTQVYNWVLLEKLLGITL